MKYIDVRVRIPIRQMGQFVDELPAYAQMIGYDKLEELITGKRGRKPNGEYKVEKGSAGEAILKILAKQPLSSGGAMKALARRFKKGTINSGFYTLVRRGLITKQKDGRYVVTH